MGTPPLPGQSIPVLDYLTQHSLRPFHSVTCYLGEVMTQPHHNLLSGGHWEQQDPLPSFSRITPVLSSAPHRTCTPDPLLDMLQPLHVPLVGEGPKTEHRIQSVASKVLSIGEWSVSCYCWPHYFWNKQRSYQPLKGYSSSDLMSSKRWENSIMSSSLCSLNTFSWISSASFFIHCSCCKEKTIQSLAKLAFPYVNKCIFLINFIRLSMLVRSLKLQEHMSEVKYPKVKHNFRLAKNFCTTVCHMFLSEVIKCWGIRINLREPISPLHF